MSSNIIFISERGNSEAAVAYYGILRIVCCYVH